MRKKFFQLCLFLCVSVCFVYHGEGQTGSVSGYVADVDNNPVVGIQVIATTQKCGAEGGATVTDSEGKYIITGLLGADVSKVYVYTSSGDLNYTDEWWGNDGNGTTDCNSAEPLYFGDITDLTSINFSLGDSSATKYTLTVIKAGSGNVTLNPPGGVYNSDTAVRLTANPDNGWYFSNWSGKLSEKTNSITITMNDDKVVTATFTERLKWAFQAGDPNDDRVHSPAVGDDGMIYVGSSDGNLYAIHPDGTQKWAFQTGSIIFSSPAIGSDGTIYIGPRDGKLYAINPDGTQKWFKAKCNSLDSTPAIGADGTIYSISNSLYAINPNGTIKWINDIGSNSQRNCSPAIGADGTIYTGGAQALHAVNPDGTQKWVYSILFGVGSPAIGPDGTIYVGSVNVLYAINSDGTLKWTSEVNPVSSTPTVDAGGTIYIASSSTKTFYAINPDGTQKWMLYGGNPYRPYSSAIGADGMIYVIAPSTLYTITPDGTEKLALFTTGTSASPLTIGADGTIYVGAGTNLYAINSDSGGPANSSWPMFCHDARHTGNVSFGEQGSREDNVVPLTQNTAYEGSVMPWNFKDFSIEAEAGKFLLLEVVPKSGINFITLDGKSGKLSPWASGGDYTTREKTLQGKYELLIPFTEAGIYYFSIFGYDIDESGGEYTITAHYVDNHLSDVSPASAVNQGTTTITVTGLGFTEDTQASLTGAGLQNITASDTLLFSKTELYATFDLTGVQPGIYDIQVKNNEASLVLENAFEVTSDGIPGHLTVKVSTPEFVRPSRKYTCWIEYENDGSTNLDAPLFVISNNANAPMRISKDEPFRQGSIQILGINKDGPAGTLPPGTRHSIPVYFQVPIGLGSVAIEFSVDKMTADSTPVDWSSIESDIRPDDIEDDAWNVVFSNLKAQMGGTWAEYHRALCRNATYLSTYRKSVKGVLVGDELSVEDVEDISLYDVRTLLQFELSKASGELNPRSTLASATDVYVPGPGFPLVFGRVAYQPIPGRFRKGVFGRGWYHIYEYTLNKEDNGDISIKGPGDSARMFQITESGTYQGMPGDFGELTVYGNEFVLREKDGITWNFKNSGELSSVKDTNGNTLTFSYTGGVLTEILHSDGDSISIDYNGNGLINQVTGSGNRIVDYRYDGDGEHLTEVEKPGNVITVYSYKPSDGTSSAGALETITFPDLTSYHYSYDQRGRLDAEWPDGNDERIRYSYDSLGTVTASNNSDQDTLIRFGAGGEVLEIQYPDGTKISNASDSQSMMSQITNPKGKSVSIAYDTKGNPAGMLNPSKQLAKMSFDPDNSRLTKLEDARSNVTDFTYDNAGNLKTIVYPDTTAESYDYDSSGSIDGYTNRRKQYIDYTTNNRGQITKKIYPDGRTIDYIYDSEGRLKSADDSLTGTIGMNYDDRGFLEKIDYPGGYGFSFEYNNAGQRTKRIGHDGYILNYGYDDAGRLETLSDKNGKEIVQYDYDENGHLETETKGNGTVTTYDYDEAGQLLHMINYSPDGAVQSRFDYTYDDNGNRDSMTTLDGTTYYEYDDIGQLVKVTYPGGEVSYKYDDAGNRTSVTNDGVTTTYTPNNMNQYTQVGDTGYGYDDDGNMESKTDASGATTYEYDAENRLISVVTPSNGTWEYVYDALGNRIMVDHDGSVKRYVHDPTGLVDVVAEYDGSGTLVARYTHGVGLVAKSDGTGKEWYYAFDGIGHTRQLTDLTGSMLNSYDYSPFGISLQTNENISNPFRYVGRFGVIEEKNGLIFMRARYYSDELGRFISQDPIGLRGDFNLYRYTYNNAVNLVDPNGRIVQLLAVLTVPDLIFIGLVGGPLIYYMPKFIEDYKNKYNNLNELENNPSLNANKVREGIDAYPKIVVPTITKLYDEIPHTPPEPSDALEYFLDFLNYVKDTIDGIINESAYDNLSQVASEDSRIIYPVDPNEKSGSTGIGDQHYITAAQEMSYTIYFENKSSATAPAQEVFINDYLDENLDYTTFRLGEVSFGDKIISTLAGKENAYEQVILDNKMAVDIEAQFKPATGLASWTFRTIDAETGELPEDALAGFLPPEDGKGSGQGYVTFTIQARKELATGTKITNSAAIIFDTEAPINTNEVFNTITDDAPNASSIQPSVSNGATDIKISTALSWSSIEYATSYDLYLWESDQNKPNTPTANDLVSPFYDLATELEHSKTYKWQVIAKNVMGESEGPVWSFTTGESTYLRDAILILKVLADIDAGDLSYIPDISNDSKKGLPEVIYFLQNAASLR